ncbi:MFS monocarboxylate transporter-like protein [Talaromyces proteolyticus]|uniref:MFS monocarboxylate transporter-like protein n=1 Tax=Talaromyces proteolyticus TaxID=1131652 RepID=A0AAD4Q3B4_9EURO|nr:MFS monocarboxylate transporter-like protein [Talaromyces proteolyticus]KAH8701586.1 MFS monocarboxylate transporter-like protein [Talaromyces proteolyticus]
MEETKSMEPSQDASPMPNFETEHQDQPPPSEFTSESVFAIVGASCVTFCTVGFINAFGVFQEYYEQVILSHESPSTIAWIGSFNIFCMFGGMMVAGMLEYKLGPTLLMIIGGVITVFSLFMTSLCKEFYQFFLAQGLVLGLGICLVLMPAFVTVTYYFRKSRGVAMGIVVAGSSLGGVIWPITLHKLIDEIGFGWSVRTAAFMMIPLLSLAVLTVRRPKNFVQPKQGRPDLSFLKNPIIILLSAGLFFIFLGLFSPFFYVTSWTTSLGHDPNLAFYMISVVNSASLFGRIIPGMVADKIGIYNVLVTISIFSGLIATCWTKATSVTGIIIFSLAYGFSSGGVISLQAPCAAVLVAPSQYGVAMGFVMTTLSIAGLIGTPLNGQLLGAFGYLGISLFSGLAMILGSILIIIARLNLSKTIVAKL